MSRFLPIDGVRLKFRTEERDGRRVATATIWIDEEAEQEIATLDLDLVERPGDSHYQDWVDSISAAFRAWLARRLGVGHIVGRRRAPDYKGEGPVRN